MVPDEALRKGRRALEKEERVDMKKYVSTKRSKKLKNKAKTNQRKETLMRNVRPTHPSIINCLQQFQER